MLVDADPKLEFEMDLALVSSQPWVKTPKHLCMWNGGTYVQLDSLIDTISIIYKAHNSRYTTISTKNKFLWITAIKKILVEELSRMNVPHYVSSVTCILMEVKIVKISSEMSS